MNRPSLSPLVGLLASLVLLAFSSQSALAQLSVTWVPAAVLGGSTGAQLVPAMPNNFTVTVRSVTGAPVPGALVELLFGPGGGRIDDQQNAGTTILCPPHEMSQTTNAAGVAAFNPRFSGWDNAPQVLLRVAGVNVTVLPCRSVAMSSTSTATSLAAFNLFAARFGGPFPEADFDFSGGPVGLGDLSVFSAEFARVQPAQNFCP